MKSTAKYSLASLAALFMLLLTVAFTGCNTTGCTENRSSIPLAGFYDTNGRAISISSVVIGGVDAPNDSLLLNGESADAVYLPLRQTASTASFFFAYKQDGLDFPELNDTLTFNYESIPYFVSEECGAMLRYRVRSLVYTRHLIDSVALIPADSTIVNIDIENMKIFFKTSEEPDQE